ncbi:MAG TPA: ferredoxin [Acidimicrobiales bacterium]
MAGNIHIDRDACMGSGNCSFWAPSTFDLDDEGKAIVVNPSGDPDDKIAGAVEGCPTTAITIVDHGA